MSLLPGPQGAMAPDVYTVYQTIWNGARLGVQLPIQKVWISSIPQHYIVIFDNMFISKSFKFASFQHMMCHHLFQRLPYQLAYGLEKL